MGMTARYVPAAAIVLLLSTPFATWWMTGLLGSDVSDPDYAVRPLDLPAAAEALLGAGGLGLGLCAAIVLIDAHQRRLFDQRWWFVIGPLLSAGVLAGFCWGVITAPGIGANIGAGFAIIFGTPIIAALLVWGTACLVYLSCGRSKSR